MALLEDLDAADCTLPRATIHTDGSGCFIVYGADREKAALVFNNRLGVGQLMCEAGLGGMVEFSFNAFDLLGYKEAWPYYGLLESPA